MLGSMNGTAASPRVPPSFLTKYNRYVDNILEKINKVLRSGYDPVNVRLHSVNRNKKPAKTSTEKTDADKDKKKKKTNKKKNKSRALVAEDKPSVNVTVSGVSVIKEESSEEEISTTTPKMISRAQPAKKKNKTKNANKTKTKNSNGQKNSKPRAKATLYGMASLKRSDDVTINVMSSHTTVKSKFTIGPLTLKVEREFGRGAKKELRSATATTTEMVGKINLRMKHGGAATLHSIRVMQPNLLRVDTPDDHDKTREFIWKKSSQIAEMVSQKLTKAARSLLTPQEEPKPKKKKPAPQGILSYLFQ